MNERVLQLLIQAKNNAGPAVTAAKAAFQGFSNKAKQSLKGIRTVSKNVANAFKKNWIAVVAVIFIVQKAVKALIGTIKDIGLEAAVEVENLRVRLRVVLGSIAEGNKVFEDMARLAGEVPKTYQEIMSSATDLAGVVKGGSEDIKKLMPIIVDISAATGISVRDTTSQMIRMYSAGAAAADMFRERGITAALGFQAGVSISAKETIDTIVRQWEDGTGKFVGASEQLKSIWIGLTSMLEDKWFNFKRLVGEAGFFDTVKLDLAALNKVLEELYTNGEIDKWSKKVSDAFVSMYNSALDFVAFMISGSGQVKDIFNEMSLGANSLRIGVMQISLAWQHLRLIRDPLNFKKHLQGINDLKNKIAEAETENTNLAAEALKDYSETWKTTLQEIIDQVEIMKEKLGPEFAEKAAEAEAAIAKLKEEFAATDETVDTFASNFMDKIEAASQAALNLGSIMGSIVVSQIDRLSQGIGSAFSNMVMKGKNFGKSMMEVFANMGAMFIQQITAMIVKWAIMQTIGAAFSASSLALASGMAATLTSIWSVPATLASIATGGGAASVGALAVVGALAASQAAAFAVQGIPALAEGGIVRKPTLALIGEKGPEAVVPLSSGGMGTGSTEITVNIDNASFNSQDQVNEVMEELVFLLDTRERSRV